MRVLFGLLLAVLLCTPPQAAQSAHAGAPMAAYQVVEVYDHDPEAFTQGLLLDPDDPGALYESTGLYGRSSVRRVDLLTGRVLATTRLPRHLFGEGLALARGRLYALTWRSGQGITLQPDSLAPLERFAYAGDGWGLAACPAPDGGTVLAMSNGTAFLTLRDPADFRVLRTVEVTDQGLPVAGLNELECAHGLLYANVWPTPRIAAIDPRDGAVRHWLDLSNIMDTSSLSPEAVANGIAHDPATDTFLVTGKLWPLLFRIRIHQP
jgi:glutamine cyclotransferase